MYTYDTPQKFIITYNIDIREDLVGDKESGERERWRYMRNTQGLVNIQIIVMPLCIS